MVRRSELARVPGHVGFIPDGNRRWAAARGLPRQAGYRAGVDPGLALLETCREIGIPEVSVYGFTKENVRRASEQVAAFQESCCEFAERAAEGGAAVLAVGDARSEVFPERLRPYLKRGPGDLRVNLIVNYNWQWDLGVALAQRPGAKSAKGAVSALGSREVPRVDLVVRWGGRRRLSGFLPMQCAYADVRILDTLWPDMETREFVDVLRWYQDQEPTLGG